MQLTSLQEKMVDEILSYYNPSNKSIVEFKSPTGSGKTLMASSFIARLIESYGDERFIFIIATPSSADLPKAFETKLNRYKSGFNARFEVQYLQSPSSSKNDKSESIPSIRLEQNKVYIFGKASFGKGRILSEFGIIDDFIKESVESGYKIIYIRDEAHIGTTSGASNANFESLLNANSHFILKMTATPSFESGTHQVIMSEKELNDERFNDGKFLLKTTFESILEKDANDDEVLEISIKKFKEIQKEYKNAKINVNPAMLIQVDNEPSDKEKKEAYKIELEKIKNALNKAGLAWIQYFGESKDSNRVYKNNFSLESITANNNDIEVIIFKIGPATGWDIPRACMLVQLRNVSSTKLNTQTIGRIKRNPYPNLAKNEITDKYYLFSNFKDNDEIVRFAYKVKGKFLDETFLSIEIDNAKELRGSENIKAFKQSIKEYLNNKDDANRILQRINARFCKGIYKKPILNTGGRIIYANISNVFVFLKEYKKLRNANQFLYENITDSVKEFANIHKVQSEFVMMILLDEFRSDLMTLYKKSAKITPRYKIKSIQYDPKEYIEIYNKESREKTDGKYLFDIKSHKEKNKQPLDSAPEKVIFDKLYDSNIDSEVIKIWAKNLTTSNIYGEYLDDENSIKRSYFDFIVKFENGFYLYIEAKSKSDINPQKTKLLENAYAEYFRDNQENLFKQLFIAVCKVNTENNDIYNTIFCDKQIYDNFNRLSFDAIIKTISDL